MKLLSEDQKRQQYPNKSVEQIAYETYCMNSNGYTPWEYMTVEAKDAWRAVATSVIDYFGVMIIGMFRLRMEDREGKE